MGRGLTDLKPGIRHYKVLVTGKIKNPNGTYNKITRGEEYFKLPDGSEIECGKWLEKVKEIIAEDKELSNLYSSIQDYCREHCKWLHTTRAVELHAAECLILKSYIAWDDFDHMIGR